MTEKAPIDAVAAELYELAEQYAIRAEALADDPYFREAVIKVAISTFAWSLYDKLPGATDRWTLECELNNQASAVARSVHASHRFPEGDRWPTLQTIDHSQLAMPRGEEDRARAFYRDLLGLPEQPKPAALAKRGGCWFESGRVKVHLGVEEPFRPAKKAHTAFRVSDVQGLAARARAAGYEVVDDELLEGFDRIYIYDPFGNRLEFMQPVSN